MVGSILLLFCLKKGLPMKFILYDRMNFWNGSVRINGRWGDYFNDQATCLKVCGLLRLLQLDYKIVALFILLLIIYKQKI